MSDSKGCDGNFFFLTPCLDFFKRIGSWIDEASRFGRFIDEEVDIGIKRARGKNFNHVKRLYNIDNKRTGEDSNL